MSRQLAKALLALALRLARLAAAAWARVCLAAAAGGAAPGRERARLQVVALPVGREVAGVPQLLGLVAARVGQLSRQHT